MESQSAESAEAWGINTRRDVIECRLALAEAALASRANANTQTPPPSPWPAFQLTAALLTWRGGRPPRLYSAWQSLGEGFRTGQENPHALEIGFEEAQGVVREKLVTTAGGGTLPYALYPEMYALGTYISQGGALPVLATSLLAEVAEHALTRPEIDPDSDPDEQEAQKHAQKTHLAKLRKDLAAAVNESPAGALLDAPEAQAALDKDLGAELAGQLRNEAGESSDRGRAVQLFLRYRALLGLVGRSPKTFQDELDIVARWLAARSCHQKGGWLRDKTVLSEERNPHATSSEDGTLTTDAPDDDAPEPEDPSPAARAGDALDQGDPFLLHLHKHCFWGHVKHKQINRQYQNYLSDLAARQDHARLQGDTDAQALYQGFAARVPTVKEFEKERGVAGEAYASRLLTEHGRDVVASEGNSAFYWDDFRTDVALAVALSVYPSDDQGTAGVALISAYVVERAHAGDTYAYPEPVTLASFGSVADLTALLRAAHERVQGAQLFIADGAPHLTKLQAEALAEDDLTPAVWPGVHLAEENDWKAPWQYHLGDVVNEGGKKDEHGLLAQALGLAKGEGARAGDAQATYKEAFHWKTGATTPDALLFTLNRDPWFESSPHAAPFLERWAKPATSVLNCIPQRYERARQRLRRTPFPKERKRALDGLGETARADPNRVLLALRSELVARKMTASGTQRRKRFRIPS